MILMVLELQKCERINFPKFGLKTTQTTLFSVLHCIHLTELYVFPRTCLYTHCENRNYSYMLYYNLTWALIVLKPKSNIILELPS